MNIVQISMCGVGGIMLKTDTNKHINDYDLSLIKIRDSLVERGPDEQLIYKHAPEIGIVHTRLSIQDPFSESSKQPLCFKNLVISYNGEIYNHLEIRKNILYSRNFKSQNDAETLINLIDQIGIHESLKLLDGIFAFSLYDLNSKKLYLVRDHIGIKPLFYWDNLDEEGMLVWGSYPASIVYSLDKKWNLNYNVLEQSLLFGSSFGEETLFKGIKSVPKASILEFSPDNSVKQYKFFSPTHSSQSPEEALAEYIPKQKLSDVKKTIFLSGGIDSSFLATFLDCKESYHLFSVEQQYAKAIAKKCNSNLSIVYPENFNMINLYSDFARITGQINVGCVVDQIVAKKVSDDGFKVGYTGHGADELFFGYDRISLNGNGETDLETNPGWQRQLSDMLLDPKILLKYSETQKSPFLKWTYDYLKTINYPEDLSHDAPQRILELNTYTEHLLLSRLDHASMIYGVEMRVPFLSPAIINSSLSFNSEHHCSSLKSKSILKQRLLDVGMNTDFIQRRKKGFAINKYFFKAVLEHANLHQNSLPGPLKLDHSQLNKQNMHHKIETGKFIVAFTEWKKIWIDSGRCIM